MNSDSGIFASDQFGLDCDKKNQGQYFSRIVSQHQNARSERAIQNIMYMERNFMVQYSLICKNHGVDDI